MTQTTEVVVERSLDELADIARREHAAVVNSLVSAIQHAIAAGEALHEAHDRIPVFADWKRWVSTSTGMSAAWSVNYERLYVYRDRIPPEAFEPYMAHNGQIHHPSFTRALAYVRGLPPIRPPGGRPDKPRDTRYDDNLRAEAKRLRSAGLQCREVGQLIGIGATTVSRWTSPEGEQRARAYAKRANAERARAMKALRRQDRTAAARKASGGISEVYSAIRKSLQILDHELGEAENSTVRKELRGLIGRFHDAEDHVGRILRMGEEATP